MIPIEFLLGCLITMVCSLTFVFTDGTEYTFIYYLSQCVGFVIGVMFVLIPFIMEVYDCILDLTAYIEDKINEHSKKNCSSEVIVKQLPDFRDE